MIRMVGAALVMVSCTGLGFRIAREFRERPKQLRALMHAIRVLRTEIDYSITPLPQAFARVAERAQPPIKTLFQTASVALRTTDCTVVEAFDSAIEACTEVSALKPTDFEVLKEFSKTLGMSDRLHQMRQIEATLTNLESLEKEAQEGQRKNERLWQYLGVLGGLLLLILLY